MPPLVVRGTSIEELPRGSMALGIVADATFTEQRVDVAEDDCLVVYSDGITEAMNAAGDFFGDERLRPSSTTAAAGLPRRPARACWRPSSRSSAARAPTTTSRWSC